jgi:hypothetical protein
MEPIENIEEVREWYETTLEGAAENGREDFQCGGLRCEHCPFKHYSGSCNDPNAKGGAGVQRTVEEWQQWWYELTGESDTRTAEEILAKDGTETAAADEPTVTTAEHTGEDTLQPTVSAPNVDIIWTTAMGAVKHRAGHIALLGGEMQQFSSDVGCWISEMSKPDTCNGVADSIMFVARDETGAVLANVSIDASLFGKRKVWESLER